MSKLIPLTHRRIFLSLISSVTFVMLLSFMTSNKVSAQVIWTSGFENWTGNQPDGWVGLKTTLEGDSISQYTTSTHGGSSACRLVNRESAHKRFTTDSISVTDLATYTISFWVRGHGKIRTGLYDGRPTGSGYATYNPYLEINSTTWTQQTQSIAAAMTTTAAEFIFSVQLTFGDLDDLQIDDVIITQSGGSTDPSIQINTPQNGSTVYGTGATIGFTVLNFVVGNPGAGIDGHIHLTLDNGSPVMYYSTAPIVLSSLTAGNHSVILMLVDNSHQPLTPNTADTVNFILSTTPPNLHSIYDIQYTTDVTGNSPFMSQSVSTYGIVTAKHASGYFLQDGDGAWNGVYVYDNVNQPVMGDSLLITGTVQEYYNLTEIGYVTAYNLFSSGNPQPSPAVINCASVNSEPYEGVLVKVQNVTCVDDNAGFGMWKIEDASDTAKVHNLIFAYTPTLNEHYDVTGPVYFSFNEFRIEPRNANDIYLITGIDDPESENVSVYPNPVYDYMMLPDVLKAETIVITDLSGRAIMTEKLIASDDIKIDVSSLETGLYFINVYGNNGLSRTVKFVKE